MNLPLVKICGTTSRRDARLAIESGADFVGVVLDHPPSQAIASVRPWAVDCASGVERCKGEKDAARVRAFVSAAKAGEVLEG